MPVGIIHTYFKCFTIWRHLICVSSWGQIFFFLFFYFIGFVLTIFFRAVFFFSSSNTVVMLCWLSPFECRHHCAHLRGFACQLDHKLHCCVQMCCGISALSRLCCSTLYCKCYAVGKKKCLYNKLHKIYLYMEMTFNIHLFIMGLLHIL